MIPGSQGLGQLKSPTAVTSSEFFIFFYRVFNSLFFYVFTFFLFIRIKMKTVLKVCAKIKSAPSTHIQVNVEPNSGFLLLLSLTRKMKASK